MYMYALSERAMKLKVRMINHYHHSIKLYVCCHFFILLILQYWKRLRGDRVTVEFISVAVSAITHTSNASTTYYTGTKHAWVDKLLVGSMPSAC